MRDAHSPSIWRLLAGTGAASSPHPSSMKPAATPADWLRLVRLHHGFKNLFVLAAPFFGGRLLQPELWPPLGLAILCFALCAGAVYALNDAADHDSDRRHPRKRRRPVAAGRISPRQAVIAALGLALAGLGLAAFLAPTGLVHVLLGYLLVNLLYSGGLKEWPVLDLIVVASGFVLRVIAGSVSSTTQTSAWLILCTALSTLFLAAAKRRSERAASATSEPGLFHHRPVLESYPAWVLELLCWVSATAAAAAYALYAWTEQGAVVAALTAPLAVAGLVRYGLLTRPGSRTSAEGESPELLLWKDPILLGLILAWGLILAIAVYLG